MPRRPPSDGIATSRVAVVTGGRDTLHLSRHDIAPIPGDLWIDPTTYLIVRSGNPLATTDYEWLPRNAASLAQLVPVIPPGFTFRGHAPETPPNADGGKG